MAKVIGYLNEKEIYNVECEEQEFESHCSNIIIDYGIEAVIKMYDNNGRLVDGTEEWLT